MKRSIKTARAAYVRELRDRREELKAELAEVEQELARFDGPAGRKTRGSDKRKRVPIAETAALVEDYLRGKPGRSAARQDVIRDLGMPAGGTMDAVIRELGLRVSGTKRRRVLTLREARFVAGEGRRS
jgi:hypothetical protein